MPSSHDRLLQHCTVKLIPANSSNWGTGFWVTPNRILTCAHVVAGHEEISVWWQGHAWASARVEQVLLSPVDLALLQLEPPEGEQPSCVLLSEAFNPFDRLYVYGYPDDFPDGGSVTIQCEGDVQEQGVTLIKAQKGQVRPGHSGSPALNWETGRVCGIVSETRNRSTDLGGLLIPVSTVFSHFPDLQTQNQAAHPQDSLWWTLPLQSPAVSQPRSAVPPPQFSTYNPATFAGRTAETATLTACLQGSCRILAIAGITGIGKTALAERVVASIMESLLPSTPHSQPGAEQQHDSLPYYRFSLDNLSLTPDFASSGAALLRELGEEPTLEDQQDSTNLVAHILERLRCQPCRVQIDSVERLLRGNEQEGWSEFCDPLWLDLLQRFLAGTDCPSQLILTSQDIPGDLDAIASRYPQFWHCEPLQGLNPDEQRTLFQNLGLNPTEADGELLQRIGAFYDGHPLVLQVIAEEIRQSPFLGNIRQYWHHYEAEFTTTAPATASKLDRSRLFRRRVRQRVEQTIQRLPEPARQMLCASAVFRRPVPVAFWQAMLPNGDADAAFDTLQDRHLVEYPTTPLPHHPTLLIRQHNLIRSVAYALLKADLPTWESAERQAAYLWLNVYKPAPDTPNLETVRGYLEAFDHYCNVGAWDAAYEVTWTPLHTPTQKYLSQQLSIWGYFWEEYIFHYKQLDAARKMPDFNWICAALGNMSTSYKNLGKYEQAIGCLEILFSCNEEGENPWLEEYALGISGIIFDVMGKYELAIQCLERRLSLARKLNNLTGEATALCNLGIAYGNLEEYTQAINYLEESLSISKKIDDKNGQSICNLALSNQFISLKDYRHAIVFLEDTLRLACHTENLCCLGAVMNIFGLVNLSLGQYSEALKSFQEALRIFRGIDNKANEAITLKNLAELHHVLGEEAVAQQYCQQALVLATELGIPLQAECEVLLAELNNQTQGD